MQYRKLIFAIVLVSSISQGITSTKRRRRGGASGYNSTWGDNQCTNANGVAASQGNGYSAVSANNNGVKTVAQGTKGAFSKTGFSNVANAWGKSSSWHKNKHGHSQNSSKFQRREATAGKTIAGARGNAKVSSSNGLNGASAAARGNRGGFAGSAHQKIKDNWAVNQGCAVDRKNGRRTGYKNKYVQNKNAKSRSQARFGGKGGASTNANENGTSFGAWGTRGSGGRAAHDITEKSVGESDSFYADRRGRKSRRKKSWGKHQSSQANLETCVDGNGYTLGQTDQDKGLASKSQGTKGTKTRFGLSNKRKNWGRNSGFDVVPEKDCLVGAPRRLGWREPVPNRPNKCRQALGCVRKKLAKCKKVSAARQETINRLRKQLKQCRNKNKNLKAEINKLVNQNNELRKQLGKCRKNKRKCVKKPPVKPCGCKKKRNDWDWEW